MATHSRLREFNPAVEDWISYAERLEFYFTANEVQEADKQRAVLFSVCGAATYKLIKNLLASAKPSDTSFKDIVKLLTEHYQPKPSRVVQCYLFNSCVRKQGESVATYVAELKRLFEHCEFAATLNDMLCDRLACGINDSRIQRRLLAEPVLNYKKAYELALALEAAEKSAQDLQAKPSLSRVEATYLIVKTCHLS